MPAGENCENCGRVIGRLETPHLWRKHVVCATCHANLTAAPPPQPTVAPRPTTPPALKPRPHYHAAAPAATGGPPPPPIDLRPTAPAQHPASMFLCTNCGGTFPLAESASDHGKIVCRTCAIALAAEMARTVRQERRQSNVMRTVVAVAAVAVIGGVALGAWKVIGSRTESKAVADAKQQAATTAPAPFEPPPSLGVTDLVPRAAAEETVAPAPTERGLFTGVVGQETATTTDTPSSDLTAAPAEAPPAVASAEQVPTRTPVAAPAVKQIPAPQAPQNSASASAQTPTGQTPTGKFPAAPAPAPAPPPPDGTAAFHVYQGKAQLAQNKLQPALEQFTAALKLDRNDPDAHHGAGLCYHAMGNRDSAVERLEKAHSLYNPPNRAAVYNLGVALLKDNPMRCAKLVMDFLSGENAPPDEQMHNLLGRSLSNLPRQAQKAKLYADAEAFYYAYNAKLETGRTDGRLRWGSEWVPARDANEKWNRFKTRKQNAETLRAEVDQATKRKEDAWSKVYDMRTGMRLYSDQEKVTTNKRYEEAAKSEIALRQKLKAAETEFRSTEKPPMPQILKPVSMDATSPPPIPGGSPGAAPGAAPANLVR